MLAVTGNLGPVDVLHELGQSHSLSSKIWNQDWNERELLKAAALNRDVVGRLLWCSE